MSLYDSLHARQRIHSLYMNPPSVRLGQPAVATGIYTIPFLQRETGFYSNRPAPNYAPVLAQMFDVLETDRLKFRFGRSSAELWEEHFLFRDVPRPERGNKSAKAPKPKTATSLDHYVNASRATAQAWFAESVIRSVGDRKLQYVLGDPGCGKSSLLKYLILRNWNVLREKNIVFSRFEFNKFRKDWLTVFQDPEVALCDYILTIALRDMLLSRNYSQAKLGSFERRADVETRDAAGLQAWLVRAFETAPPEFMAQSHIAKLAAVLDEAMMTDELVMPTLREIDFESKMFIVRHIKNGLKLAIVLDGLDIVAMEDNRFQSKRLDELNFVLGQLDQIGKASSESLSLLDLKPHLIVVMRENTFHFINRERESFADIVPPPNVFRVGPLDPYVVIHRTVLRALSQLPEHQRPTAPLQQRLALGFTQAIFLTLGILARSVGAPTRYDMATALFAGNIRSAFDFLQKLLRFFVEEAIKAEEIAVTSDASLLSILQGLTGKSGLALIRRRKYRLVEILLFNRVPWFENAVQRPQSDRLEDFLTTGRKPDARFRDNPHHTGMIDNIFNYHNRDKPKSADEHCLLEKLRILQVLSDEELTLEELEAALVDYFGYEGGAQDSICILLRTQLITIRIGLGGMKLTATARGRFLCDYLCINMAYLEHVFHQTLMPAALVRHVRDNYRDFRVDDWAAHSIRNTFILLTYIKSVEDNEAHGRSVRQRFRILPKASAFAGRSLMRILMNDDRKRSGASGKADEGLASRALRLIDNTIADWELQGIVQTTGARSSVIKFVPAAARTTKGGDDGENIEM